ncbi:hypothetical protein C0Q70_20514 [Pomacea canaliculata]|uniref:40S ribosomal protein S15 n=1 Tax=Pomacea canaliculata TaxID=400727 RepID=A0A2T7NFS7_POMCA|nr:hypothetical protein C0Q70_20514 [Pomacea canaliculata]
MADEDLAEKKKKRTFRKFTYRGVDLDQLLDMSRQRLLVQQELISQQTSSTVTASSDVSGKTNNSLWSVVKTHLRDMIIVPEMIGSIVGVYNGKTFNQVEIKPEMIGHYLGEFSITYKPVKHGRPGIGATHSSRFIPLK